MTDICFAVMPFGSVRRPALGVSLLKAALMNVGISAKIYYFNLKLAERIGIQLHDKLAETSLDSPLIGELVFASFAFQTNPWKKQNLEKMIYEIFGSKGQNVFSLDLIISEIMRVQELIPEFLDDCAYNILRESPRIVGFTSTFEQNCASIALAKTIKEATDIPIIFGGANCESEMGSSLLRCAPWVDFVCSGEGDISSIEFINSFLRGDKNHKVNGIITRESSPLEIVLTNPVMNLDDLPFPDFDDYFSAFECSLLRNNLDPELVIETSRGCWWGEKFQCTFCGLNGLTIKFRSKSIPRVLRELQYLTNRHKIRKFQVVDNILDLNYVTALFPEVASQRLGIKFFYETKANISKKQLILMKQGGVTAIQPGIESFSDDILKTMKKGVVGLQNIQILKWCREIGVVPLWNLIWGFPSEAQGEYDRMSRLIPLLAHLHPPAGHGQITLDRFSPYFVEPLQNGIINVRPWVAYRFLYPLDDDALFKMAYHFDFDYSDRRDVASYTKELEHQLIAWKKLWENENNGTFPPVLNMVSKRDFVMIEDLRPCAVRKLHILANEHAKTYTLCETMHNLDSIFMRIQDGRPLLSKDDMLQVLSDLIENKLMIHDNGRYLSLAVPASR